MDNSEKTRAIRRYRKSSLPRLRWTPHLHHHFVQAVQSLGGKYKATPKKIMQIMGVKGLKISHVKSHLQMYRSMRESRTPNEFIAIKNYQPNRPNLRQICPGSTEAQSHMKLVRLPFTYQAGKIIQKGTDVLFHEYQGAQRSSTGEIMKGIPEVEEANMEVPSSEINFLSLGNQQSSQSSSLTPINLDLTISSH